MSEADSNARVNAWLVQQFRAAELQYATREIRHLHCCESTRVVACEHGYECGCYSEYTRDDEWRVAADFACLCGTTGNYRFHRLDWGVLPEMIEAIKNADLDSSECPYDEEDERG